MGEAVNSALAQQVREALPALYLLLDEHDRVLEANAHTRELFGVELEGARFQDLLANFDQGLDPKALARTGAPPKLVNLITFTGLPQSYSCRFVAVDERTLVVGGVEPRDQEALRRELVRINQSLSTKTRELQKANAQLKRLGLLKDRFLAMASHDLRSPLMAILHLSDFLRDDLGDRVGEEQREHLEGLRASASLMLSIVHGFLDLAQVQSGRFKVAPSPCELEALALGALRVVGPMAKSKGVRVTWRMEGSLPSLSLDGARVEQVLVNLLTNAVQHSPQDGSITLELQGEEGAAVVRVVDQGAGIPASLQKELFMEYVHGEGKTAGERSVGLGLAISRVIVEAHGGTITVQSEPGQGATFTVRLPVPRGGGG